MECLHSTRFTNETLDGLVLDLPEELQFADAGVQTLQKKPNQMLCLVFTAQRHLNMAMTERSVCSYRHSQEIGTQSKHHSAFALDWNTI